MKTVIISGIAGLLLITAAVGFYYSSTAIEKETSALVSDAANAIAYAWNPEELKTRAEPGLINAMQSHGQSVEQLFEVYSKLGKPKAPLTCTCKDSTSFRGQQESYVTASYVCAGEFDGGPATMDITVRKPEDGEWKIYHIRVNAAQFDQLQN